MYTHEVTILMNGGFALHRPMVCCSRSVKFNYWKPKLGIMQIWISLQKMVRSQYAWVNKHPSNSGLRNLSITVAQSMFFFQFSFMYFLFILTPFFSFFISFIFSFFVHFFHYFQFSSHDGKKMLQKCCFRQLQNGLRSSCKNMPRKM